MFRDPRDAWALATYTTAMLAFYFATQWALFPPLGSALGLTKHRTKQKFAASLRCVAGARHGCRPGAAGRFRWVPLSGCDAFEPSAATHLRLQARNEARAGPWRDCGYFYLPA